MGSGSKILKSLPECYGGVLLTAAASQLQLTGMAHLVSKARKEYDVKYPIMYSGENGGINKFNCIQRAHQNTLEHNATFLFFLLVGGLQYPRISTAAGVTYMLGRIAYTKGYMSEDPSNRKYGAFGFLAMLVLLGNTVSFAAHQLKWV